MTSDPKSKFQIYKILAKAHSISFLKQISQETELTMTIGSRKNIELTQIKIIQYKVSRPFPTKTDLKKITLYKLNVDPRTCRTNQVYNNWIYL